MHNIDENELIRNAFLARERSYAPYSHFHVGAALLTADGTIYSGCNIENAAYTPTNCAERTAFFKALSEGERSFLAIAIVGGAENAGELDYCAPCGVCRQVMMEFCDPEQFLIILAKSIDHYKVYTLAELVPMGFGPSDLMEGERP
jgi:cytidine deaminase